MNVASLAATATVPVQSHIKELADIIERFDTALTNSDGCTDESDADYHRAYEILRIIADLPAIVSIVSIV